MANRHTLHSSHLDAFKGWLAGHGWTVQPIKGCFEVLRATRAGRAAPLIIYKKMGAAQHSTVLDRDMPVVRQFLKERERHAKPETRP